MAAAVRSMPMAVAATRRTEMFVTATAEEEATTVAAPVVEMEATKAGEEREVREEGALYHSPRPPIAP